jgi:hypothetical protein
MSRPTDRQRFETVKQKLRDAIAAGKVADQAIVSAGDVYYSPEETNANVKLPAGIEKRWMRSTTKRFYSRLRRRNSKSPSR